MIEALVTLTRALGDPDADYAILAEGNTSAAVGDSSLLVKASGMSLRDATADSFLEVRVDALLALLDDAPESEAEQIEALAACVEGDATLRPSVESPLHAVMVRHGGARFVGHTHPVAVNSILCSGSAASVIRPLFPDQIVVCGADPVLLPYVSPGLPLARAVREALVARDRPPKVVYLENHGMLALGQTADEVLRITQMAVKAARILQGALAAGGAVFLSEEQVAEIDGRLDEAYRRALLDRAPLAH